MIKTIETRTAINAAMEALQKPGLSWINEYTLTKRAYYWGLLLGLKAIAAEDDLKDLWLQAFTETLWSREGDDTFISTKIGRTFETLRESLRKDRGNPDHLLKGILNLRECVRECEQSLQHHLKAFDALSSELLSRIQQQLEQSRELEHKQHWFLEIERYRFLEGLEHCLRVVALLETDHHKF